MLRRLLLLLVVALAVQGCTLWSRVTGEQRRVEKQAQRLDEIQQTCQRYADGFAGQVLEGVAPLIRESTDATLVDRLSYWQITQLNSAYTIATGPSPVLCLLDFVVLATLSRMVVEDTLSQLDAELLGPLLIVYRDLEREAWKSAATVITPAQLEELRDLIVKWRASNPNVKLVGFVHFSEFAEATGWSREAQTSPGSVFGLLGLDPLAGLDPAIKQIEQTRLLAERMIYYMQRLPYLLDLQTQRVVLQATLAPEVKRANSSLERATLAMQSYAEIGAGLPDAIARERDALIRQLSGEMLRQEAELRGLLVDLQATLATGSETAVAINAAVDSLDRFVARFPRREPGDASAGRPFDITEYTAAAAGITATARELQGLLDVLGRQSVPLTAAVADGVDAGRGLVDYLFWRALLLGGLLVMLVLAAALAYRALAPRLGARPASRLES